MNILQLARQIRKEATKEVLRNNTIEIHQADVNEGLKAFQELKERKIRDKLNDLKEDIKIAKQIQTILEESGLCKKSQSKLNENYFFITLRPSNDHKHRFAEFKQIVLNKYITRSCFTSYRYAWEQKGETPDEMGTGYHIHILALCPNWLKKTQLLKDTKSTFNKFFNGEVHDSFIQIDYVRTLDHYNNIHAYMSGYKADDWKDQACAMDKPWREKHGLDDSYGDLSSKSEA